jgi:hypothetical protein
MASIVHLIEYYPMISMKAADAVFALLTYPFNGVVRVLNLKCVRPIPLAGWVKGTVGKTADNSSFST